MRKDKRKKIIKNAIIVAILFVLVLSYLYIEGIRDVVNLVVISFIVSYTLKPIRDYIVEKYRLSIKKASMIIVLFCIVSFIAIMYFMIPSLLSESRNIGGMLDNLESYAILAAEKFDLDQIPLFETAYIQIGDKINTILTKEATGLFDNIIAILENLIGLAIVPVAAYYFLADGNVLYNKALLIFSTEKRIIVRKINSHIDRVLSRYIISQIILSLIIGILTFILMISLRLKMPLVLSVVNGVVNIIPYFGPIIGGVPIVFIAMTSSITKGIIALVGVFIIQQVEGDLLAPKITGDCISMHPVTIILLLILGEKIAGVAGMILCVPIAVIIKVIYDDINYYLF